ncbi:protein kinase [Reticulomyxa filosa]|uniref:Protein kinase n=1 Tax=Reticulomyxa filosa TaxID=46433 RepID=X6NP33_RETFI|nr:protein kinase [Reticulomyxa filosa]|eukprot:ETO27693.1 protein kinase [Reticulomyxa filosa]
MLIDMPKYGPEVDMWSVGCVMAEMLLRRPLFEVQASQNNEAHILSLIFERIGTPSDHKWHEFKEHFQRSHLSKQNVRFPRHENHGHHHHHSSPVFTSPWVRQTFGSGAVNVGDRVTLSSAGIDLLSQLLRVNPNDRIPAQAACDHPWFTEAPVAIDKRLFKTCPSVNKQSRKQALEAADQRKKQLKRVTGGFMHT